MTAAPASAARPPAVAPRRWGQLVGSYVPLVLTTLAVALPLLWMLLSSFKTPADLITQRLVVFPTPWTASNYAEAARRVPFGRLFVNSLIVTAVGAAGKVLLSLLTAYALVFVRFPGRQVIFVLILATLMVPPQVSVLPNYVFISELGGANTYWGIILPTLGTGLGTFLLRQHFLSLPMSIMEAAELDGASHWRRLTRIVVPISMPAIATVALVNIVFEWNEYLWPLVIVTEPRMMTLPVGLTLLRNSEDLVSAYGIIMAGTVMAILPVLVVFVLFQRSIVSGLTQGAVRD